MSGKKGKSGRRQPVEPNPQNKNVSVRVTPEMWKRLKALAEDEGRSVSNLICRHLEKMLAE